MAEARSRTALKLTLLVVAALLVRAVFLWLRGPFLDWDEAMYLLIARNLLEGNGVALNGSPHVALGPGVPAATAALAWLTELDLLVAQRAVVALAGALLIVPVWYLTRHHWDEKIAWLASTLLVGWPALVDMAPKLGPIWKHMYAGTEPAFLLFLFAFVAIAERALREHGRRRRIAAAAAGVCLGLAYLCRAETVVFGGLYVLIRGAGLVRARAARSIPALAVVGLLGFLAAAAPQLVHLRSTTGAWLISGQPGVMYPTAETLQESFRDDRYLANFIVTWYRLDDGHRYFLNPYWGGEDDVPRSEREAAYARLAARETPTDRSWPARIGNRAVNYVYMLWTLVGPVFVAFVLLGVVSAGRRAVAPFVLAGFAASLATGLYLFVLPRFFLYLVPVFAVWAALGLDFGLRALPRLGVPSRVVDGERPRWIAASLLVVISLAAVFGRATGDLAGRLLRKAEADREAARALAAALPDGPVMHWHPRFAYWGGWEWRTLPYATLDETAHFASTDGVEYVLLAEGGFSPIRASVPYLLVKLGPSLARRVRTLPDRPDHEHPYMLLRPVTPVAGYPTGVLELDDPAAVEAVGGDPDNRVRIDRGRARSDGSG